MSSTSRNSKFVTNEFSTQFIMLIEHLISQKGHSKFGNLKTPNETRIKRIKEWLVFLRVLMWIRVTRCQLLSFMPKKIAGQGVWVNN